MTATVTPAQPAPVDHEAADHSAEFWKELRNPVLRQEVIVGALGNLARAYLARCAEVEGLMQDRDKYKKLFEGMCEEARENELAFVAAEAEVEGLTVKLLDMTTAMYAASDMAEYHRARAATLAKALERIAHGIYEKRDTVATPPTEADWTERNNEVIRLAGIAREAIAAAKGETV